MTKKDQDDIAKLYVESVSNMNIIVTKVLDPLTKSYGFSAKDDVTRDAAFAFSEKEAIQKLLKRNDPLHASIEYVNGMTARYTKK